MPCTRRFRRRCRVSTTWLRSAAPGTSIRRSGCTDRGGEVQRTARLVGRFLFARDFFSEQLGGRDDLRPFFRKLVDAAVAEINVGCLVQFIAKAPSAVRPNQYVLSFHGRTIRQTGCRHKCAIVHISLFIRGKPVTGTEVWRARLASGPRALTFSACSNAGSTGSGRCSTCCCRCSSSWRSWVSRFPFRRLRQRSPGRKNPPRCARNKSVDGSVSDSMTSPFPLFAGAGPQIKKSPHAK